MPLKMVAPETKATKVMPSRARKKNSAGLNFRTIGSITGIRTASTPAPITPPTPDAIRLAPSAIPAWPFFAIG